MCEHVRARVYICIHISLQNVESRWSLFHMLASIIIGLQMFLIVWLTQCEHTHLALLCAILTRLLGWRQVPSLVHTNATLGGRPPTARHVSWMRLPTRWTAADCWFLFFGRLANVSLILGALAAQQAQLQVWTIAAAVTKKANTKHGAADFYNTELH